MMNNTYKRGFTLIELLVVIAIIGILASVVLASLNTARDKGSDAAAKGALSQLRAQAELFYDIARTYDVMCGSTQAISIMENARVNSAATVAFAAADATAVDSTHAVCHDTATAYAAAAPLKSDSTKFWCVDSTGAAKISASLGASVVVCP